MESETTQIEEEIKEVRLTNAKFASINEEFKKACEVVGVKNSTRQASKWRSKKGKAWNEGKKCLPNCVIITSRDTILTHSNFCFFLKPYQTQHLKEAKCMPIQEK